MSGVWMQILLIIALVLVNAFFAATEIAVVSSKALRVRQMAAAGHKGAIILEKLMADPSRFLATIQVGITFAGFLASASAAVGLSAPLAALLRPLPYVGPLAEEIAIFLVTLAIAYVTLVLGELAPKRLALNWAEGYAVVAARPVYTLSRVTAPFTRFLTWSTNLVVKLLGGSIEAKAETITEEEIRIYVSEHEELAPEEKRMIESVFDFGDRVVRQVMRPRTEMEALHADTPVKEALQQAYQAGYTRYPIYGEDYDEIIGQIAIKDLVAADLQGKAERPIREILRPAIFVPESRKTIELLKDLQRQNRQMAIVVDEYGGTAGVVTMEDLVQQLVGDLAEEEPEGIPELLDGRTTVEEAIELGLEIPEGEYETVSGFILHQLGRLPVVGDETPIQGALLRVERMKGLRIAQIRVVRPQ